MIARGFWDRSFESAVGHRAAPPSVSPLSPCACEGPGALNTFCSESFQGSEGRQIQTEAGNV